MLLAGATVSYWTFADSYSGRPLELGPEGPPLGEWAAWSGIWVEELALAWLAIFPLLSPTGRLPSARWSGLLWIVSIGVILSFMASALQPGPFPFGYLSGVMNPAGIDALGPYTSTLRVVGRALLYGSVAAATASLIFRLRRSNSDERQQMKWVCVAYVFVSISFVLALLRRPAETGDYLFLLMLAISLNTLPVAMAVAVLNTVCMSWSLSSTVPSSLVRSAPSLLGCT
jgi:hypothetical protein